MQKRTFLLSLAALPLATCRSPKEKKWDAQLKETNARLRDQFEQEQRLQASYAAAHARHRCEASAMPEFSESNLSGSLFQERRFDDHLVLRLRLGNLIKPSQETPRPFPGLRTTSKYQLLENGQMVCEAPSLLTKDMPASVVKSDSYTQVFWHPQSRNVLIDEGREWSNVRRIAVWQEESGGKKQWLTKLIDVPFRPPSSPSDIRPVGAIRGVAYGRLYVEVDSVYYAIPLHEMESATDEFSPPG